MDKLLPGLKNNFANMADPEAKKLLKALNTLRRVGAVGENDTIPEVSTAGDIDVTLNEFNKLVADKNRQEI